MKRIITLLCIALLGLSLLTGCTEPTGMKIGIVDESVAFKDNKATAAGVITTEFLKTFLDFPPRQEPGSFNVDNIIKQMQAARAGNR